MLRLDWVVLRGQSTEEAIVKLAILPLKINMNMKIFLFIFEFFREQMSEMSDLARSIVQSLHVLFACPIPPNPPGPTSTPPIPCPPPTLTKETYFKIVKFTETSLLINFGVLNDSPVYMETIAIRGALGWMELQTQFIQAWNRQQAMYKFVPRLLGGLLGVSTVRNVAQRAKDMVCEPIAQVEVVTISVYFY